MKERKILTTLVILILTLLIIASVILMVHQEEQQKQQTHIEYRLINVLNTSIVDCHTIRQGQAYNQTHCIYVNEPRNLTRFVSR